MARLYRFAFSPFTFVFYFTVASAAVNASGGYLSSVLSNIEQRFQLKSSESALLFTIYDVVSFSSVLFVTHFGNRGNIPKMLALLFLFVGIATILQAMPHFLYAPPKSLQHRGAGENGGWVGGRDSKGGTAQLSTQYLCDNTWHTIGNCTEKSTKDSGALWHQAWWIYAGNALAGLSISVSPLAITYLDDSSKRHFLPLFVAIIFGSRSTGSTIGGFVAQQCLSVPSTWPYIDENTITDRNDPLYLGAWWLGFLPINLIVCLSGICIFFFPKHWPSVHEDNGSIEDGDTDKDIPYTTIAPDDKDGVISVGRGRKGRSRMERSRKKSEPTENPLGEETVDTTTSPGLLAKIARSILGFWMALLRVLRNGIVISLMLSHLALSFSTYPDGAYASKYLQYEFRLSAADASAILAWSKLPMIFVAYFFSAVVMMIGRMKPRGSIIMVVICVSFVSILTPLKLLAGCDKAPIAGLTEPYDYTTIDEEDDLWTTDDRNLTSACNADCYCPSGYNPVCASSGISYSTACHAGCSDTDVIVVGSINETVYKDCSCYEGLFRNTSAEESYLTSGLCETDCSWVFHFVLLMLTTLLRSVMCTPTLICKLRYVDEEDRAMIQGLDRFLKSFLAKSTGPILYGIMFDKSCLLFQLSCGISGNCLVYDIVKLRILLFGLSTIFATTSLLFAVVTLFLVSFSKTNKRVRSNGYKRLASEK